MFIYDKFTEEIINLDRVDFIYKEDIIDSDDKTFRYIIHICFNNNNGDYTLEYITYNKRDIIFDEIKNLLVCKEVGV